MKSSNLLGWFIMDKLERHIWKIMICQRKTMEPIEESNELVNNNRQNI